MQPILGTLNYNAFIAITEMSLGDSLTPSGQTVNTSAFRQLQNIPFHKISDYVTAVYDKHGG
jgi:hypothetical protein